MRSGDNSIDILPFFQHVANTKNMFFSCDRGGDVDDSGGLCRSGLGNRVAVCWYCPLMQTAPIREEPSTQCKESTVCPGCVGLLVIPLQW